MVAPPKRRSGAKKGSALKRSPWSPFTRLRPDEPDVPERSACWRLTRSEWREKQAYVVMLTSQNHEINKVQMPASDEF
jgi:hypothetical protein